jgi:hypothetical protein
MKGLRRNPPRSVRNQLSAGINSMASCLSRHSLKEIRSVNGPRDTGSGAGEPVLTGANGEGARFVGQINRLQEELYAERQKNKRLKGA